MAADVDVVVLDEHESIGELAVVHQLGDALQDALAGFIEGMRLAGENEPHGTLRVVDHRGQLLNVGQAQVGALVGGEAPRKADGERVGAEDAAQPPLDLGGLAAAPRLLDGAAALKFEESRFQHSRSRGGSSPIRIVHGRDKRA